MARRGTENGAAVYSSEVVAPLSTKFRKSEERLGNTSLNEILMIIISVWDKPVSASVIYVEV